MLTEKIVTLLDGVDELGNIRVKQVTQILKGGVPYGSQQFHRHVLAPGDDVTGEEAHIAAMATAVWTPENVKAKSDSDVSKLNAEIVARQEANAQLQVKIEIEKENQATLEATLAALASEEL